jgi:MFS family permease
MTPRLSTQWKVLFSATLGIAVATTAMPFYAMGAFIQPLEASRGWSRSEISFAISLLSFCLPLSLIWFGRLIDVLGVRTTVATGHILLGLCYLGLSVTGANLHLFWALYAAAAVTAGGASPVAYSRVVVQTFDRRRGAAIGFCMVGAGASAAIMPPALESMIRLHGIDAAYRSLALTLFVVAGLTWLLLPGRPRNAPPASQSAPISDNAAPPPPAWAVQRPLAVLTAICVGIFAVSLSVSGFVVHMIPILEMRGWDSRQAADLTATLGLAIIAGRIGTGYALDKVSTGLVGATVFFGTACGIVLLNSPAAIPPTLAIFLIGLGVGAEVDIVAYLLSRLSEKAVFSRHFSIVYAVFMIGSGLSPLLLARIFELSGSYRLASYFSAMLLLAVCAGCIALHLIQRRISSSGGRQQRALREPSRRCASRNTQK